MFERANSIFAIQYCTRQIGGNAMCLAALPNQSLHSDATALCHLLHRALWISVLHPKSTLAVPPVSFVVRPYMTLHAQLDELIQRVMPVVRHFHNSGMLAPHAATIDNSGSLKGHALTSDGTNQLSVAEALSRFQSDFRLLASSGEIHATGIFYHSPGIDTSKGKVELPPANTVDECKSIVGLLEHISGQSIYIVIPYRGMPGAIEYGTGKLIEKPVQVFVDIPSK